MTKRLCIECGVKMPWYTKFQNQNICTSTRKRCLNCLPYNTRKGGSHKRILTLEEISEIKKDIYNGKGYRQISKKYKISFPLMKRYREQGLVVFLSDAEKEPLGLWTRKSLQHTEDTKQRISIGRKKFLTENPHMVPYLLNHSSKVSYPEKYWAKIFQKYNIPVQSEHNVLSYYMDFALPEQKIDIEVDGDQHHLDPLVVKSDKNRTERLEALGWKFIRIRWSTFRGMNKEGRKQFVKKLITQLRETLTGY